MARFAGNFFLSRSLPKLLDLFGFAGPPLVATASLVALQGLEPAHGLLSAALLGAAFGFASLHLFPPPRRRDWLGPLVLGGLAFGLGTLLPALVSLATELGWSWLPRLSAVLLGLFGSRFSGSLGFRRSGELGSPVALASLALFTLPVLYGLLPRLGPNLTGAIGGCFLLAAQLARPPSGGPDSLEPDSASDQREKPTASAALGILLGAGLPLLFLQVGPSFGPTIPSFGEALTGLALGGLLFAALQRRLPIPAGFAALLLLAGAEILLRAPHVVAEAIGVGIPALLADTPLAATLVLISSFALAGVTLSHRETPRPWSIGLGLGLFLLLPGLLQLETALRVIVALTALIALFELATAGAKGRSLLAGTAALLALSLLLLPQPSRGLSTGAAFQSFAQPNSLSHTLRTRSWRDAERLDAPNGSVLWSRTGDDLEWWLGGRHHEDNKQTLASDHLFAALPILLGYELAETLLIHPGSGSVLHPARSLTPSVRTWAQSAAHRYFLQAEAREQAAADPSVRVEVGLPVVQESRANRLLLVDLPSPWQPGGIQAWSEVTIRRHRGLLGKQGVALYRLPLNQVAGPSLASFVRGLADSFLGVDAWLDPSGGDHLFLLARLDDGPLDAGSVLRNWTREGLRRELRGAALREPVDLLERHLLDREGLLEALGNGPAWSTATSAVLGGVRVRRGGRVLPLAELGKAAPDIDRSWSFESVAEDERAALKDRLEQNAAARGDYLSLLEAIALGDSVGALALAARVADTSTQPSKDLRTLVQPWIDKGDRFFGQRLFDQAHAEYLVALSFSPQDSALRLRLARTQVQLGRLNEAEEAFRDLLDETPSALEPALGLAEVFERTSRFREGADLLEGLEKIHPGDVRLLINLGALHLRLSFGSEDVAGRHNARARVLFQTASSLEPRMARPRAGLAEVFSLLGDHERALVEIDRAIALESNCTYRGWRGQILWQLGQGEPAEKELSAALLDCPENLPALVALGAVLVDRGCYQQGREAWERALAIEPELPAARMNLEQLELSGVEQSLGDTQCR